MIAHALTATRLLLVAPVALAFARSAFLDPWVLFALVWVAIATDYWDGKVARATGSDSPRGQLFDHATGLRLCDDGAGRGGHGRTRAGLPSRYSLRVAFPQYVARLLLPVPAGSSSG